MSAPEITVCIPAHPARVANGMLDRAVASVKAQLLPATDISIAVDEDGDGAAVTRQRALDAARTEWVAFLDSDDWLYPEHLKVLATGAKIFGADYVFSYYMVHFPDGRPWPQSDPLGHFGKPFNPARPHQTTITTLVRTELAQSVGFRKPPGGALIDGERYGEDFQFTVECVKAGAKIVHVPRRTWAWVHHSGNTSGQPCNGDAAERTTR
ncbi:glycosyltransferase [Streptomyces sp. NBC_01373]|uniref:glycosyltransferase family 2 protein n=1 Tax=Streptomyces sp. NBC_01373 TaxID=2903843 RepID=UPI0022582448|nr:glycosyltransferase [Streptomyces sp. NBC_01373]MCX4704370.1 glycosyltransferase [Streptomyces sp. NBC_01373]MCX4707110.1 glycosyltransferase [Streptomyces sp. NBC_01373]